MYDWNYPILLGKIIGDYVEPLSIRVDDPELDWHMDKSWMRDYILERDEVDIDQISNNDTSIGTPIEVETGILSEHALVLGATGSGKTIASLNILHAQLQAGASAVVIDVKPDTISECIAVAQQAGLTDNQITVVWPQEKRFGVAGWNPLAIGLDPEDSGADFIDIILEGDRGGVQYGPPLRRSAEIMAAMRLSIQEQIWFFRDAEYRAAILNRVATDPMFIHQRRHLDYFANFERNNKGNPPESVGNKIEPFEELTYFFSMLTAQRDTLRLAELWKKQRVILIHLGMRTDEENRMFSAMITKQLKKIAERNAEKVGPNKRPVILMLDELRDHAKMVKDLILDVATKGRSQGLWLLAATQTLRLLPEDVREVIEGQTALKVLMRVKPDEARALKDFVPVPESVPTKIAVSLAKKTKDGYATIEQHCELVDGDGDHISLDDDVRRELSYEEDTGDKISIIKKYLKEKYGYKTSEVKMLDSTGRRCGIPNYSEIEITPQNGYVRLTLHFPKPKTEILRKSNRDGNSALLSDLEPYEGYVHIKNRPVGKIRTTDFSLPDYLPDPIHFLRNGQSQEEIKAVKAKRKEMRERLFQKPVVRREPPRKTVLGIPVKKDGTPWFADTPENRKMLGEYEEKNRLERALEGEMPRKKDGSLLFPDTPANRKMLAELEMEEELPRKKDGSLWFPNTPQYRQMLREYEYAQPPQPQEEKPKRQDAPQPPVEQPTVETNEAPPATKEKKADDDGYL